MIPLINGRTVYVEEVVHNKPGSSLIVLDEVSNKNIHISRNNIAFLGDSIPKGINAKNLKSRLYNANCSCHFFGVAISKHFHHYIL